TLWHQRLGHPADPVLDVLKSSLNLDSQTISEHLCDTCNKAKQTREPFPLSDHKSSKIGELVHLDVWGPYKVTSRDGFRYFLTVVDDFTRAVWIYMLKGKDDVYDSIVSFAQMITNQFETNVKTFRSDNGSEFVNNKLQRFFNEKDPKRSNDEGRVSFNDNGSKLSPDNNNQGNDDSDATPMEEINNTHPEGNCQNEIDFINDFDDSEINSDTEELPVNNLRRSSRQTKLPSSLNDFIVEGKVKYGVERVVNYANLKLHSFCFATALNKSIEPTCYEDVVLDSVDFDETFSLVMKMSTDIDEDIYMTIPKGFENKDKNNKVCKLVKSLYGLKQAPRKWNGKLVTILKENGFIQSINDHSLFTKTKDNKFIALLVYVDDIVVTGNLSTPMVPNSVLSYEPTDDDPLLDNITGYQKLLGKLIYLTHTRPDIAYSVHCLAQHMHSPLKSHMSSALNVLRYLKGAFGKGIRYQYPDIRDTICGYSDADWAKCLKTRKSALQLAVNPVFHERSKHFEIDVHFIREKLQKGC
ncbi:ribonuclease H-like domain-containing protein, partial [Tanacetum coccineum]